MTLFHFTNAATLLLANLWWTVLCIFYGQFFPFRNEEHWWQDWRISDAGRVAGPIESKRGDTRVSILHADKGNEQKQNKM